MATQKVRYPSVLLWWAVALVIDSFPSLTYVHNLWFQQERALKLWWSGDHPDKDTKTSFICRPWAIRAAAHFQTIKKLSERKWLVIIDAAITVIGPKDEFDPTGENSGSELDDPDEVIISESEDEAPNSD